MIIIIITKIEYFNLYLIYLNNKNNSDRIEKNIFHLFLSNNIIQILKIFIAVIIIIKI